MEHLHLVLVNDMGFCHGYMGMGMDSHICECCNKKKKFKF
jgi:hypothetical protein